MTIKSPERGRTSEIAIFARIIRADDGDLSGKLARYILTLGFDEADQQRMRDLAQREKGTAAGLDGLLLEMMAMDSEKHARLLQFVQQRLEKRARGVDGPSD